MRININGTCIYDDSIILPAKVNADTVQLFPTLSPEKERLLRKTLPEIIGIAGITSITSLVSPGTIFANTVDASARLISKEQTIIHMLQTIATPAAIAIAIWGLIEWAVLNNPHGKKKIWESLWLLIGIKFIPDIWMAIAG